MSGNLTLDVARRDVLGKQVKQLRRNGLVPCVVYGPTYEKPVSVQVDWASLRPVLTAAGATSLIVLNVDGNPVNVLVRDVQRHPIRREIPMHIDFYAVDLNTPFHATVPLVFSNAEAVSKRLAVKLFQPLTRIEVECLPADIPHTVSIDLSSLKKAGDLITVGDLPAIKGVTFLVDDEVVVVRSVSLAAMAAAAAEDEAADAELYGDDSGAMGEPEVIRRGKDEDDEEND